MKYTEEDFFKFERSTNILLDSVVDYLLIELKQDLYTATINFIFPFRSDYKSLQIYIEEIVTLNINQGMESVGQQIHNYKFLKQDEYYYLCLDPDESSTESTKEDQDFFLFEKLIAVLKT